MKKNRSKKIIIWIVSLIGIVTIIGYLLINMNTYGASKEAEIVSQQAEEEDNYTFYASGEANALGLIFYPGGLVEPDSYSLWAKQIAQAGYDVYVMHFPLNLAVLAPNRAQEIQNKHPEQSFVLAGHSLGGVMASRYIAANPKSIAGMIFFASYPDEKGALTNSSIPVLSITATNDGVLNQATYEEAKQYLPKDTIYEAIEGGNHAGFGSYGVQKGDKEAAISNEEQQAIISQLLIEWLNTLA